MTDAWWQSDPVAQQPSSSNFWSNDPVAPQGQGQGPGALYTAADSVVGTGKGLVQGVEGLAGLPGDVQSAMRKLGSLPDGAVNWLRQKMGKAPLTQGQMDQIDQKISPQTLPTSSAISQYGSDNLPDAQTGLGQHLQYISSFVPQAAAGPEGLAKNLLMRGALPGAVSDALGTAGDYISPTVGTVGRVAGALFSPSGNAARVKAAEDITPSAQALIDAGGAGRNAYRGQAFATYPGVMERWANDLLDHFENGDQGLGASTGNTQQTTQLLQGVANGGPNKFYWANDLDALQYKLDQLAQTAGGRDATAAQFAKKSLEQKMGGGFTNYGTVNNPQAAGQIWNDAQGNYAAGMRGQTVDQLMDSAKIKSLTENSGLGGGNRMKKAVANFISNDDNLWGFTDAEKNAMLKMATGNKVQNFTRAASNMLGGGGGVGSTIVGHLLGGGLGAAAGAAEGGGEGAAAGDVAGTAATMLAGILARRAYNRSVANVGGQISRMIRGRSPLGATMRAQAPSIASVSPALQRLLALHQALQTQ